MAQQRDDAGFLGCRVMLDSESAEVEFGHDRPNPEQNCVVELKLLTGPRAAWRPGWLTLLLVGCSPVFPRAPPPLSGCHIAVGPCAGS